MFILWYRVLIIELCVKVNKPLSLFYLFCKALCSTMLALRDLYILVVYRVWEFITVWNESSFLSTFFCCDYLMSLILEDLGLLQRIVRNWRKIISIRSLLKSDNIGWHDLVTMVWQIVFTFWTLYFIPRFNLYRFKFIYKLLYFES